MDLSQYLAQLATLDEPTNIDNSGVGLPPSAPVDPTAGLKPLPPQATLPNQQSAAPASLPAAAPAASNASDAEDDEDEKSPGPGGKSPAPPPSAASSAAASAGKPSAYDDLYASLKKKFGIGDDTNALASAQAQARQGTANANLEQGIGSVIQGLSFNHAPVNTEFYDNLRKQAQTPVQQLIQKRAFGEENLKNAKGVQDLTTETIENDPASPMNQSFRTMLQKIPAFKGINLDGVTVRTPGIEKLGASFEAAEARKVAMAQTLAIRQQTANDREMRMVQAATTGLGKSLDPSQAPSTSVFGRNAQIVSQAAKLNQLFAQSGYNLDNRQMHELAVAQAVMLANGGNRPAQELIESLVPNTGAGKWNKAVEYFSNTPTGLDQQAFAKKAFDMVNRESDLAQQKIKEAQYQRIAGYEPVLKRFAPDSQMAILSGAGIDPGEYAAYVKNGRKLPSAAPQHQTAPGAPGASSPPPAGKVKVSNGTKSFFIDPADLAHAQADGFKQVQ